MLSLSYDILQMPSDQIRRIYKTVLDHNVTHEVVQDPVNTNRYTIYCQETKKNCKALKQIGFQ